MALPPEPPASRPRAPIVALHPGALGDVLQAVPALRALGGRGPVALAAQPRLAALLRDAGAVAEALPFDAIGLEALFTPELPAPAALAGRALVVSWFGASDALFGARLRAAAPGALIASPTGDPARREPVWQQLLDGVTGGGDVGATPPGAGPDGPLRAPLTLPPAWRERAQQALAAAGADPARAVLLVHPGAGGTGKRWPAARFAAAVERLGAVVRVVVHQGPADAEAAGALAALLRRDVPRLVEPELPVLSAVLALSAGYLGSDSGVSQLAAAVGAPGVIVYPPETAERWAPWTASALAVPSRDDPGQAAEVAVLLAERLQPASGKLSAPRPGTSAASRPSSRASP